jgi:hypothetical protein
MPQGPDLQAYRSWSRRYLAMLLYWAAFIVLLYALTP